MVQWIAAEQDSLPFDNLLRAGISVAVRRTSPLLEAIASPRSRTQTRTKMSQVGTTGKLSHPTVALPPNNDRRSRTRTRPPAHGAQPRYRWRSEERILTSSLEENLLASND